MKANALQLDEHLDFFQNNIGFLLGRVHRLLKRNWEAVLKDIELTAGQASLLSLVANNPGISLRKAGRCLANDPMNSHRIALDLGSKQLLQRYKDPHDKRLMCMKLTPLGLVKFEQIQKLAKKNQKELLEKIGQDAHQNLLGILINIQGDLQ